jgi:acyl carrier protein
VTNVTEHLKDTAHLKGTGHLWVTQRVRRFIIDELGWEGAAEELTDDLLLIQEGALDSIGIVSLTSFLESYYGILMEDSEIVPANLGSLASIERYVQAKNVRGRDDASGSTGRNGR